MNSSVCTCPSTCVCSSFGTVTNISLFIPYLHRNIKEEKIKSVFLEHKIGIIKRVDFITKINKKNQLYNSAFLHFESWFENEKNIKLQVRLKNTELDTRIIYQANWFWVIKENNSMVYNLTTNNPVEEKALGSGYITLGNKRQRISI
jgi:hypothetical protein